MYLWVLTLATKSEPTLIGQLALSLQMISILDVVSSSIALCSAHSDTESIMVAIKKKNIRQSNFRTNFRT
jgi:hypothetical protein